MKSLTLTIIGVVLFISSAMAQITITIGSPPQWGPIGYTDVRYYYLPDVEAYYDIQTSTFLYFSGGTWIHRSNLPWRHRHYDLYNGYKVVINDYRGNSPYDHFSDHKRNYKRGVYHGEHQKTYRERDGEGNSNVKKGRSGDRGDQGHPKSKKNSHDKGKNKKD